MNDDLRWLETVSSTQILMGLYNHYLSLDAIIMVSENCPAIVEHVIISVSLYVTIATVGPAGNTLNYIINF